jgi:acetoin utilization protein AcuB
MTAKIKDLMTTRALVWARPDDYVGLAVQMMLWTGIHHLPVIEGRAAPPGARTGNVLGVLSESDILRRQSQLGARAASEARVSDAMSAPATTISADAPLVTALSLMLTRRIGCLPVVDDRGLAGIVTKTDLLRYQLDAATAAPAGALPPPVRAIMTADPAVATPDTEVLDAASLMTTRRIRHLPVVDTRRRVLGMVSDRDIRAAIGDPRRFLEDEASRGRLGRTRVEEIMSRSSVTVAEDAPATVVVDHLIHERMGALPVVDAAGCLVGIVSYVDALQALR